MEGGMQDTASGSKLPLSLPIVGANLKDQHSLRDRGSRTEEAEMWKVSISIDMFGWQLFLVQFVWININDTLQQRFKRMANTQETHQHVIMQECMGV